MVRRWFLNACILAPVFATVPGTAADPPSSSSNWHQWRGPNANGQADAAARPPVMLTGVKDAAWANSKPFRSK